MLYEDIYEEDPQECHSSGRYRKSREALYRGVCHFLFISYFVSAALICVLKLYDQFLPFCLYDDGKILTFQLVCLTLMIKAVHFSEPDYYLFYTHSFDLIRFVTSFAIIIELESVLNFFFNMADVTFYLKGDPEAAWKLFWIIAMGLIRIPMLSIFLYLQHKIHNYGKANTGKHCVLLFSDVAMTQFYFLTVHKNDFDFLAVWMASLVCYFYHNLTKVYFHR